MGLDYAETPHFRQVAVNLNVHRGVSSFKSGKLAECASRHLLSLEPPPSISCNSLSTTNRLKTDSTRTCPRLLSNTDANCERGEDFEKDKFLVGYQGWFTCTNDGPPIGEGHHGWLHWLNQPLAANGRPNTDLWPDTSAYDPSELYSIEGLTHHDGAPAKVFSSRDPRTVRRHFHWMAEHGVDGAFLQRFVGQVDPEEAGNRDPRFGGTRRLRDEVGRRVREAAEAEGRVWAVMYDVSGVPAADIVRIMTQDFAHLVHEEGIFDSSAYLHERSRPVVAVWGFGLSDSPVSPHAARVIFNALRAIAPDLYIFAGVPSHWRSPGQGDAHGDPAWSALWLGADGVVDALSPWSVGRYSTSAEVENWAAERWEGDAELIAKHNEEIDLTRRAGRRVDYVPVVLPGGSGFNLSEGKWAFNGIKRNGGKFLWSQIFHAKRLKGIFYSRYDEGTAFLPVVEKKRLLPQSETWPFLALDEDGYDLPSDWYMRVAGFAAEGLRSERRIHDSFPSKELQDYWSSRPRYEEKGAGSVAAGSSASSTGAASSSAHSRPTSFSTSAGTAGAAGSALGGAGAGTRQNEQETEAAREARAQFDAWAEEQRIKEAEAGDLPPPAYSLEDDGPAVQAPVQQQQQPIQQQQQQQNIAPQLVSSPPPQQQHSQQQRVSSLPPQQQQHSQQHVSSLSPQQQHFGADAAVSALAGDFARQHIGASPPPLPGRSGSGSGSGYAGAAGGGAGVGPGRVPSVGVGGIMHVERPPLHPAHPARGSHESSGSVGGSGLGAERPPLHPSHPQAPAQGRHDSGAGAGAGTGGSGSYGPGPGAGPRVGSPEVQVQGQWAGGKGYQPTPPSGPGYQQAQYAATGYQAQGKGQGAYQQHQNTGGSVGSVGSSYPPQGQQYPPPQQQQNTGGSGSSAYPAQAQHTHSYDQRPHSYHDHQPAGGPAPHQQYGQPQQPHHTGGSGSSTSSYAPPSQAPRPGSAYPGQASAVGYAPPGQSPAAGYAPPSGPSPPAGYASPSGPSPPAGYASPSGPSPPAGYAPPSGPSSPAGYAPPSGPSPPSNYGASSGTALGRASSYQASTSYAPAPGSGLAHSSSLSARPDSAPRPTTPGYASYPPSAAAGGYPSSPPPHGGPSAGYPASLAPRPDSVRPTTPGYPGQQSGPPRPPPGPQHSSYPNQYPSHNSNGPPPASYPGSSYNPPPAKLPSPEIAGPAFPPGPMASQYAPYHPPPHAPPHQSPGPFPGQTFPGPHQGGFPSGPPPPGSPPYPPAGPSFPHGGSDNNGYFYQQPQPFPGGGYSPQADMYHNNYGQPQQGPWAQGGGPPPMPHRPGSQPQPYGSYGAPGFPAAAPPPPSGPLGFATSSMDKIVGRRTREQLEGTVDSLAQSDWHFFSECKIIQQVPLKRRGALFRGETGERGVFRITTFDDPDGMQGGRNESSAATMSLLADDHA
ncbi:hypothetical protein B0H16DRAFT_1463368 [Mycena metata]|uniref:Xylosidase/arabinosidase n=1 Tax=Mycena metata TaxID=1033252 RepID=A0AAD7IIZ1_9AGAR|nr:hypothetical protein B0H16DRAFT_1463368 [Mycena metata]